MKLILVIEDNELIRENISEILSLANYDVIIAENGKSGILLAQDKMPDLIICDIMMPELDGYGVLHILSKKPETASIPFVFLTAKTARTEIRKGMNMGADDYLVKPFDSDELLNVIEVRLKKQKMNLNLYQSTTEGLELFISDAAKILNNKGLRKGHKTKRFRKKSLIYKEAETPIFVFMVKYGNIKSFKSTIDGKELIFDIYKDNDLFGFESILQNSLYHETAVAMQNSELVMIPKMDFLALIYENIAVSKSFINFLCKRVSQKETQLLNLAYNSVRQRTAEALLKIVKLRNTHRTLNISRDDLSKIVGTATESVIRVLSDFKEEKLIEIECSKINVVDSTGLKKVVQMNVSL